VRNAGLGRSVAGVMLLLLAGCSSDPGTGTGTHPVQGCGACGTGLACVQNADFPEGACTALCNVSGCPSGTACTPPLSTGNSYCLPTCGSGGSSCPGNLVCTPTSKGSLCLAPAPAVAAPASCAAPQLVVGSLAGPAAEPACRTPVVSSALPAGDVQKLGIHRPGETVAFQMPAGAAGFSIVSQAADGGNAFLDCGPGIGVVANVPVPSPILAPGGRTFFDETANLPLDLTTASLVFFSVGGQPPYTQALTFPNTTAGLALALDGGLPGGQWTFQVNDYANEFSGPGGCDAGTQRNTYDVQVVVSPGPLPARGELSVDIYLVTHTFTAAAAVSNPAVQRFANSFASIYAAAGVCLTTVSFHDVPAWAANKYASLPSVDNSVIQDPCSDFRQMMTLAEPGRTISLFLVDELAPVDPQGNQIVGQDGAIAGMATYNGTIAGGAAVSMADLTSMAGCTSSVLNPYYCGPDETAAIAAHETGHFLGLYHPTEETGDVFDPLVDTATCVCSLCTTGSAAANCSDGGQPTLVSDNVCSGKTQQCGGANLTMFWVLTPSSQGQFSPEEAAVLRTNPLLAAP